MTTDMYTPIEDDPELPEEETTEQIRHRQFLQDGVLSLITNYSGVIMQRDIVTTLEQCYQEIEKAVHSK